MTSSFSQPISTGEFAESPGRQQPGALPAGMVSSPTDASGDADVPPLWIVFPLCAAVVVVLGFVILVVLIR